MAGIEHDGKDESAGKGTGGGDKGKARASGEGVNRDANGDAPGGDDARSRNAEGESPGGSEDEQSQNASGDAPAGDDEHGQTSNDDASKDADGDDERIASLDRQIRQLQARKQKIRDQAAQRERKRNTKRRIVLGGGLVARARDGDHEARRLIASIRSDLTRESDKKAFAGWEVPRR